MLSTYARAREVVAMRDQQKLVVLVLLACHGSRAELRSAPICTERTAYVTVMTAHNQTIGPSTFLGKDAGSSVARHSRQVQLLLVLARSLRKVELCRRDFVVLIGTQVPLLSTQKRQLVDEGLILHPMPPIIPGVPTADKLHAWRLTNYTKCAILDVDMMVLQPIDDVFTVSSELTIAHHPYDHLQAQCGINVRERGIAALMVIRPSLVTYASLITYLLRRFRPDQLLYSDQTGLMCFFTNRTVTLPCHYVFDISMTTEGWLPRWMSNCRAYGKQHVLRNCLSDVKDGCKSVASGHMCDETTEHIQRTCRWPTNSSGVHAFHFKGSKKPWRIAEKCPHIRRGLSTMHLPTLRMSVATSDTLIYNEQTKACTSQRHQQTVYWKGRSGAPGKRCCNTHALMAAQWYSFVTDRRRGLTQSDEGTQLTLQSMRRGRVAAKREARISQQHAPTSDPDEQFTEIPADAEYRPPGGGVM